MTAASALAGSGVLAVVAASRRARSAHVRGRVAGRLRSPGRRTGVDPAAAEAWLAALSWHRGAAVATVGAGGVAVVLLVAVGPGAAVVGAGAALAAVPVAVLRSRSRTAASVRDALPLLLDQVASGLRSGRSLHQALAGGATQAPPPVGPEVRAAVAAASMGVPLTEALSSWADGRPLPEVQLAVSSLTLGAETGGRQARALEGVAEALRERASVRNEARALAAQARASAAVMVVTPIGFAAAAAVVDPRVAHVLGRTPLGATCLAAGLTLDATAAWWMARIVGSVR